MNLLKKKPPKLVTCESIEITSGLTVEKAIEAILSAQQSLESKGFKDVSLVLESDGDYPEDGYHLAVTGDMEETDEEYDARLARYEAAAKKRAETKARNKENREFEKRIRAQEAEASARRCSTSAYFSTGNGAEARSFRCCLETGHMGDHRYMEG